MRALPTALLLCLVLGGCHWIFRYEDRPADGGGPAPDLDMKLDRGAPPDRGEQRDGLPDRAPPDVAPPPDLSANPDAPAGTWTPLTPSPAMGTIRAVWGVSTKEIYLAGSGGSILRFDGAATYTPLKSATTATLTALAPMASKHVVAVGTGAVIRVCDRTTQLCTLADPPANTPPAKFSWEAVWCSAKACYLGGSDPSLGSAPGGLFRVTGTPLGGWTWTSLCNSLIGGAVRGVFGVSDNQVYVVGKDNAVVRYDASASLACKPVYFSILTRHLAGVWATSTEVMAVGTAAASPWGAAIWLVNGQVSQQLLTLSAPLRAVTGRANMPLVMAGSKGLVLRFDGLKLTTISYPGGADILSVWLAPNGDIYAVGANNLLLRHR